MLWDGREIEGPGAAPVRATGHGDELAAVVIPAWQHRLEAGEHRITLRVGTIERTSTLVIGPTGGLSLDLAERFIVVHGADPLQDLRVRIEAADGVEEFVVAATDQGAWRSARPLPGGTFRIICQSGGRWAIRDVL